MNIRRILLSLSVVAGLLTLPVAAQTLTNGKVTAAAPPYPNNSVNALSLDLNGNLRTVGTYVPPTGGTATQVQGTSPAGSPPVGNPVWIGGSDGTNIRAWAMNSLGFGSTQDAADVQEGGAIANTIIGLAGSDGTLARHIKTDTIGNQIAVGNIASGSADSGNPVKIGCVYNAAQPAPSSGQRVDCQVDSHGSIRTVLYGANTTAAAQVVGGPSDGSSSFSGLQVAPQGLLFNGTSWDRQFTCPLSAVINTPLGTTTQLVALVASQVIRVCSFVITESLSGSATFEYGTGALCATGTTALTGAMALPTGGDISLSSGNGSLFRTASANALCLAAVTGNITGFVTYAQY